ncbi:MAG: hypothetical protein JOY64_38340 [Alphaproteobacteria bacterium]|nr:hypothetical protein [Alphaproteobacteria bacterium]MBV8413532.1 hypothetical protein [Alphaproteobacteria bacterium]
MHIDTAYLTPAYGLLGAAMIAGSASFLAAIYSQRTQARLQRVANEINRRDTVYADFLVSASKLLLMAYTHDGVVLGGDEQHLVGLVNRMRLFASPEVIAAAEAVVRAILEIALQPGVELRQLAIQALNENPEPDPFRKFSLVCRADLEHVHRTVK